MKTSITVLTIAGIASAMAAPALAKEVPIGGNTPTKLEGKCTDKGGTYFNNGTTFACLYNDGSVTICGGVTPAQKKTCTTSRADPNRKPFHMPTRSEIRAGNY